MAQVELKNVNKSFGPVHVIKDVDLEINKGEFVVFVGPSGCGKSTLLRLIAGLETLTSGEIVIADRPVMDLPPSERGIAMVFQSYALYPHMTVFHNMAFSLSLQGLPKSEIQERVEVAAKILQMEHLLERRPAALSGGQRQRVAIGRAIVRNPEVFLFDEPLSNLDAALRHDTRVEIAKLHNQLGATTIYVTHDQVEAMTLADRISIMKDGLIEQLDTPEVIYAKPCNKYVADFIGSPAMNLFAGQLNGTTFTCDGFTVDVAGYEFADDTRTDGAAWLGIRPEHIVTGDVAQGISFAGVAEIDIVEPMGSDTLVWVNFAGQSVRVRTEGQSGLKSGDTLSIGFDAARLHLFDVATEIRL